MHCRCSHHFNTKITSVQQDDKDAKWFSESWKYFHHSHQNWTHRSECLFALQKCFRRRQCTMQLQLRSSDDETCTYALFKLIAFAIKNVTRHQLLKLLNNHHYHEESQAAARMMMKTKLLKQFKVTKSLIL